MKHSENKAAGAHQQAKGLLDELEEVRRKYGLAEEIAPRQAIPVRAACRARKPAPPPRRKELS